MFRTERRAYACFSAALSSGAASSCEQRHTDSRQSTAYFWGDVPRDQRLVQTAVLGSAESDLPVMLPVTAVDVDRFRGDHVGQTFWCGRWLGGCGSRLTTKLYQDRVCHFAHVADPARGQCRRAAVGIASADHLYIRQQVLAWLADKAIPAQVRMPQGPKLGGEVLFDPSTYGCLRVLLDQDAVPPPAAEGTQTVLGPGVAHDPYQMTVHGYVLRIRCDTVGAHRRVMLGTQTHNGTDWFALEECQLEPWGLSTPTVAGVRRLRSTHQPLSRQPSQFSAITPAAAAGPLVTPQAHDDRDDVFATLQKVVESRPGATQLRHWLNRAEAVTRGGASAAENDLMRLASDELLRIERGVGLKPSSSPPRRRRVGKRDGRAARLVASSEQPGRPGSRKAVQSVVALLDALHRRRDHITPGEQQRLVSQLAAKARKASHLLTENQRTEVIAWQRMPPSIPRPAARPAPAAPPSPSTARRERAPRKRQRSRPDKSAPGVVPSEVAGAAETARDVLEHAARLGKTVPFSQFCAQVKGFLSLGTEQQHEALKHASRSRSAPLASLITTDDGEIHRHYRHLAKQAGRELPADGDAARAAWREVVTEVHNHYRLCR